MLSGRISTIFYGLLYGEKISTILLVYWGRSLRYFPILGSIPPSNIVARPCGNDVLPKYLHIGSLPHSLCYDTSFLDGRYMVLLPMLLILVSQWWNCILILSRHPEPDLICSVRFFIICKCDVDVHVPQGWVIILVHHIWRASHIHQDSRYIMVSHCCYDYKWEDLVRRFTHYLIFTKSNDRTTWCFCQGYVTAWLDREDLNQPYFHGSFG